MSFREWEKSSMNYGRKLMHSGVEGARSGEEEFLHGRPITPFLNESAQHAVMAATIGAAIGLLSGFAARRSASTSKPLAGLIFGGAFGFGAGVAWECRHLGASVIAGALKSIGQARDEHWLEKNPIDYA